jgi:subtilisin family serine protease
MTLRYLTLGILGLLLYPGLGAANAIRSNEGEPDRRTPLRHVAKTGGRTSFDGLTSRVIVKFREGTPRHVVDSALGKRASDSAASMAIAEEALAVVPTFWRSPEELQAEEARLESSSEIDLADLSLYLDVRTASPERAERLARRLESFDEIEVAYVQATPLPPGAYASHVDHSEISKAAAPLAVTPDFTGTQFYLGTAPGGFGIKAMRNEPGGRGQGIRVLDIQYSWNVNHEDLPFDDVRRPFVYERGVDPFPMDKGSHGTACIGMLLGVENGFGIDGMSPDIEIGLINPVDNNSDYKLASAILNAATLLKRGEIMQIEQQARGISPEIAALPPEWEPAVFDAIQYAVAKGIVVIEPAGNGGLKDGKPKGANLDSPQLGGVFDRKKRDSGAILVGGAIPLDASKSQTSNFGSRLDVQGYGLYVTTLGYGDLFGAGDPLRSYTAIFSGTSSAAPCVTGVAAIVQATLKAAGLELFDSRLMRSVLAGTGSPDGSIKTQRVGPRPNAVAAVGGILDPSVPLLTDIKFAAKKNRLTVDGVYFKGLDADEANRAVILINGTPIATSWSAGYYGPYDTTTRLTATGPGLTDLLPSGEIVFVTVRNGSGTESPRRIFIRK